MTTAGAATLAFVLVAAGMFVGNRTAIEGAYFTRSVGSPAYAGVFSGSTWKQDALLGAGLALMLVAAVLAVVAARAADERAAQRMLRRAAFALALAGVGFGTVAFIRALTGPLRGLSLITRFEEGGFLTQPYAAPDFLLGAGLAFAVTASVVTVRTRRAP